MKNLFKYPLFIQWFVFFLLSLQSYLYYQDKNTLSEIKFASVLVQSMAYVLIYLRVFEDQ